MRAAFEYNEQDLQALVEADLKAKGYAVPKDQIQVPEGSVVHVELDLTGVPSVRPQSKLVYPPGVRGGATEAILRATKEVLRIPGEGEDAENQELPELPVLTELSEGVDPDDKPPLAEHSRGTDGRVLWSSHEGVQGDPRFEPIPPPTRTLRERRVISLSPGSEGLVDPFDEFPRR